MCYNVSINNSYKRLSMAININTHKNKNGEISTYYRVRINKKNLKINKEFDSKEEAEAFLEELKMTEYKAVENYNNEIPRKAKQKKLLKKINIEESEIKKQILYIELYKESLNFQDFFNQLNLINNTHNFYKFKKIFKQNGFNDTKSSAGKKIIDYQNEIFIENSPYGRSTVKRVLIREKILEYKCNECENTGMWNGKPLTLQLEHKNGFPNDNRLENLEFLCPNCHSQTSTFAARNKKAKVIHELEIDNLKADLKNRHDTNDTGEKISKIEECKLYAKLSGGECLSEDYTSYNTKLEWKCANPEHSSWFSDFAHVVKRKRWCPECKGGIKNKNGLSIAKAYAKSKNGQCLALEYINCDTKMEWKCDNPEHSSWNGTYYSVVNNGSWCPYCNNKSVEQCINIEQRKLVTKSEMLKDNMTERNIKILERAKNYARKKCGICVTTFLKSERNKLEWKCKNINHEPWEDTYINVVNKNIWCKECKK